LDFLSSEDQIRVQRLLDLCEEKEPTHVATQTTNSVTRPNVVATQTAPLIATEISETVQCKCQKKVLDNQEEIKRMLNTIILMNKTKTLSSQQISNTDAHVS
jgi:hypothetical protein